MFEKVSKRAHILQYLPDNNPDTDKFIDREFLFNVVNTCDQEFFPQEITKLEDEQRRQSMLQQKQMIEVQPELMELLEAFGKSHLKGRQSSKSARGLAALKVNSKKRSRAQFEQEHHMGPQHSKSNQENSGKRMKMSSWEPIHFNWDASRIYSTPDWVLTDAVWLNLWMHLHIKLDPIR